MAGVSSRAARKSSSPFWVLRIQVRVFGPPLQVLSHPSGLAQVVMLGSPMAGGADLFRQARKAEDSCSQNQEWPPTSVVQFLYS